MPLVRINHPAGKPFAFRAAISKGVYQAMLDTFNVPTDDHFQVLSQNGPGAEIVRPPQYLAIVYSDDLIFIQNTCNDGRTVEQKKALYAAIADSLTRDPGLRREDIFISLVEVQKGKLVVRQRDRAIRDIADPLFAASWPVVKSSSERSSTG